MFNGSFPVLDLGRGGLLLWLAETVVTLSLWQTSAAAALAALARPPLPAQHRLWRLAWIGVGIAGLGLIPVVAFARRGSVEHAAILELLIAAAAAVALGRRLAAASWHIAAILTGIAVLLGVRHGVTLSWPGYLLALLNAALAALAFGSLWPLRAGLTDNRSVVRVCLTVLAGTVALQLAAACGSLATLVGTTYGLAGIGQLVLIVALAIWARRGRAEGAGGLAIAVAMAAFVSLAGIVPPPSRVQPVWPFTEMASLVTLREDPDFRREAIGGVIVLAGGIALVAIAAAVRRVRWAALIAGVILVGVALPHLDLFFVPAYPTSFYRSPTGFAVGSIVAGAALYPTNCASCHGSDGRGDGPLAKGLPVPPADLTAAHLWAHSDGELFWWVSHGMAAPSGAPAMPAFGDRLDAPARWALIDYIRAHNGGAEMAQQRDWTMPVKAPDFALACVGRSATRLQELHGHVVRLVFAPAGDKPLTALSSEAPAAPLTVVVGEGSGDCHATAPDIRAAYAVVTGTASDALAGAQLLIDPDGWLRDLALPGHDQRGASPERWQDPALLLAEIREICNHPIVEKEITHAAQP